MREFELLRHVYRANPGLPAGVVVPPGDDLAQIRLSGRDLLVGVDQVVEGRHFTAETPIDLVGRKAVSRSMSDVAAMAGRPVATLAAVVLPVRMEPARILRLFEAVRRTAEEQGGPLIGGDMATHKGGLVCSVTVLAEPTAPEPLRRSGAHPGDAVYVTGRLGGSIEGRHLTFEPRIAEAIALGRLLGRRLHAMIDVSDGLGRDAGHIAEDSGARIEIDVERIPRRPGTDWRRAASDGEDYELCFTASGEVPPEILGLRVTNIGRVLAAGAEGPGVFMVEGDSVERGEQMGWEHG